MFAPLKYLSKSSLIVCEPITHSSDWILRIHSQCREYVGIFTTYNQNGRVLSHLFGRVVEWPGLPVDVYIHNPPPALRLHPHGHCLQLLKPGQRWFKLHWERPARTFEEARAYVEQMMVESMAAL